MNEIERNRLKKECRDMLRELVMVLAGTKATVELENPGAGNIFIDVLIEETEKLKVPAPELCAPRRAMLSQPMHGLSEDEIAKTRERAVAALHERGYAVVNTLFTDDWYSADAMERRGVAQIPLCFLARSLENMSKCHAAYFCAGWENARGCRIEHEAAKAYGLKIIYEVPYGDPDAIAADTANHT